MKWFNQSFQLGCMLCECLKLPVFPIDHHPFQMCLARLLPSVCVIRVIFSNLSLLLHFPFYPPRCTLETISNLPFRTSTKGTRSSKWLFSLYSCLLRHDMRIMRETTSIPISFYFYFYLYDLVWFGSVGSLSSEMDEPDFTTTTTTAMTRKDEERQIGRPICSQPTPNPAWADLRSFSPFWMEGVVVSLDEPGYFALSCICGAVDDSLPPGWIFRLPCTPDSLVALLIGA